MKRLIDRIDSLLWRYSRAYRRRTLRKSAVWQALAQPAVWPSERALERPAVLGRVEAALTPYQVEMLHEKLSDEALMRPEEWWCEHCPQYGECGVCGQKHERTKV